MININQTSLITLELHMELLIKKHTNEKHFLRKFLKSIPTDNRKSIISKLKDCTILDIIAEYPLASELHRELYTARNKKFKDSKNPNYRRMRPHLGIYGVRSADVLEYLKEITKNNIIDSNYYYKLCKAYILSEYYNYISFNESKLQSVETEYFIDYYCEKFNNSELSLLNEKHQDFTVSNLVNSSRIFCNSNSPKKQELLGSKYPFITTLSMSIKIINNKT